MGRFPLGGGNDITICKNRKPPVFGRRLIIQGIMKIEFVAF